MNRAFLYADAVYDKVLWSGGKLCFWEEHYLRLMASMRILRMKIPYEFTMEFLQEKISEEIKTQSLTEKTLLVSLYVFTKANLEERDSVDFQIFISEQENFFYKNTPMSLPVELYKDFYQPKNLLSTLKTTAQTQNILAKVFAQENDYENCILLNDQKQVTGFFNGNLFFKQGDLVKTPPISSGAKNGITRKKIIQILKNIPDISFSEEDISPFDLQKGDEIFLTNTSVGIQSVTKYRKKEYSTLFADSLIGKLNTLLRLS